MASQSQGNFDEVVEKLLKRMEALEDKKFHKVAYEYLRTLVKLSKRQNTKSDIEEAESWLRFAKNETRLKTVTADVPTGILPNGLEGSLIDVKVFARRGPDDEIYDNNKTIRDKVARGNCFLEMTGKYKGEAGISCVLQGLKKFTGGLGDDDDRETGDNLTWKRYFTQSLENTDVVIATRKANGEAAHLSCRMINGKYLLCGGSKNVHLLFTKKEDIRLYAEPRFRIAREVCETVMDAVDQMKAEEKDNLLKFLAFSRYTGVFEILSPDHQHVEDLSHLKQPLLQFITWTKCDLNPVEGDELGAVPPNVGIEIARALGLQTVIYDSVPMSNLDSRMKKIRQGYQFEGEVLYFLDKKGSVIGLLKKKTVWYIMCRAIREKLRAACNSASKFPDNYSVKKTINKTEKRMEEIRKWLGLEDDIIAAWKTLAGKFLQWSMNRFEHGTTKMEDVADKFPVLWKTFLEDSGESDNFGSKMSAENDLTDTKCTKSTGGASVRTTGGANMGSTANAIIGSTDSASVGTTGSASFDNTYDCDQGTTNRTNTLNADTEDSIKGLQIEDDGPADVT